MVRVVDSNGEYHPVNKLNTNYSDQADLLYDVLELLGKIEEIKKLNVADLKSWLKVFFSTNNVEEIIRDNFDVREYVSFNRKMSDIGEEAENFVAEYFKSKGFEILYQGGDGDWIDMIYGIDLIMKKGSVVYTVQVKSREGEAKKSLTNNKYSKIDLICSPVLDVIEDAINRGVRTEGAVNLAYGNRISLLTTIDLLKAHFPDLKVSFLGDRPGDVKNSQNDPVLLKKLFPDVTPTEFPVALSETVNWLKEFGQSVANGPATVD